MTATIHRGLPWWPVPVDARIEPDGIRVVGSQAAGVLPVGSLVGWDRVTNKGNGEPHLLNELGRRFKLGRRPVALRLSDGPNRTAAIRAANSWFADPSRRFRVVIPPDSRRKQVGGILGISLCMLVFTVWAVVLVGGPVAKMGDLSEAERRADLAVNGLVLASAFGAALFLVMAARACWMIALRWHAEELTENGIRIRLRDQTEVVPWQACSHVRRAIGVQTLYHTDGRRISVEPSSRAMRAMSAKVPTPNRLWTGFFIALLLVALIGPLGTGWMFRWLGFPKDLFAWPQIAFLQSVMLYFPGMLVLHWWMERRDARPNPAPPQHD